MNRKVPECSTSEEISEIRFREVEEPD